MESDYTEFSSKDKKILFDINNSKNDNIEYKFCPHIYNHFLNPFLNSTFEKINLSEEESKFKISSGKSENKEKTKILYTRNLSLFQNNLKLFNYLGYRQTRNLFNSFLLNNLSLDNILLNNPQNLSINSMIREGSLFCLNFNDTGNLMASSNQNCAMEIWGMKSKKLKQIIQAHSEIVTDIQFFHNELDNQYMLSCSLDKTIRLWKNYKGIHTFLEHSDWVRCINIRDDNNQFLSGCVSSVVKLWDIPTQRVIASVKNQNEDKNILTTVNSLNFLNENRNLFIVGLRSGEVKLFDTRIKNKNDEFTNNMGLVHCFKAHYKKLNNSTLNHTDKYLLTASRDSIIRLWDFRKLPNESNIKEDNKNKYIYEYNKHKCVGYNIACSFYNNEQYIITGSENYSFYIYDILNPNNYFKIKTQQKCVNFVKEIPNTYNICFTGLEDVSIFIWNAHKNINKYYQNKICNDINIEESDDCGGEKMLDEIEETEKNKHICNKLIEDIMTECGDLILKIFHKQNLTYSKAINLENLIDIIKESHDKESENILEMIQEKFMEKIINNFISGCKLNKNEEKKNENKNDIKNIGCNMIQKKEIKCLQCQKKDKNEIIFNRCVNEHNVFNSDYKELLDQLLILPNKYGFYEKNENKKEKNINNTDIGKKVILDI